MVAVKATKEDLNSWLDDDDDDESSDAKEKPQKTEVKKTPSKKTYAFCRVTIVVCLRQTTFLPSSESNCVFYCGSGVVGTQVDNIQRDKHSDVLQQTRKLKAHLPRLISLLNTAGHPCSSSHRSPGTCISSEVSEPSPCTPCTPDAAPASWSAWPTPLAPIPAHHLLVENRLGLTSETLLLGIVSSLT